VEREQVRRRNDAIAMAIAFNNPSELDKALPAPASKKPQRAAKSDFVEEQWWAG
jgi:hypothetical protein